MQTPQCLAANVRSLPLVNSWYAQLFLVSPLTFGLYTKRSHLALLDSFIEDPQEHRAAVRTPELRGGPFIDYDGDVADMRRFRDRTLERCAVPLRYATAIEDMFQVLQSSAKGSNMSGLYEKFDPLIRRNVEVSYDVCKQPDARFIERLFYQGPAFDTSLQTCVLEHVTDKLRPFILSTPQVKVADTSVELQLPFADPLWADLHSGQCTGAELLERLRLHTLDAARDMPLLQGMLTSAAPSRPREVPAPGQARVRYFGHACVLMESAKTSVLFDPLVSYPGESSLPHFTFDDLPERIDYVVLTHPHQDHVVLETLLRLRHKVGCVVVGRGGGSLQDVSLKLMLEHCGFPNVVELDEYETIEFDGGRIIGAPFYGEHADLDIRGKLVFGVQMEGANCVFFADSNPPAADFYEPLRNMMQRIDCMFLGMECVGAPASWLYGPFLQKMLTRGEDQSRRLDGCNGDRAMELWKYLQPRRSFVYAMGAEPWITHITSLLYSEEAPQFKAARAFEAALRADGHHAEVLFGQMELCF
jgi:L-ascorbate metabolism protein UlaG (beta-lactamase superfamily)